MPVGSGSGVKSVGVKGRKYISPAVPSTTPTHGHFVLFPVRSYQETRMAARRTQLSTPTISRKNRGL